MLKRTGLSLAITAAVAFIACSGGHQVMVVSLAAAPDSWEAKEDPSLLTDHMLTLLDVGETPVQLALKPDTGEIYSSNFGSNSVSEIEVTTNEVGATYTIANKPVFGLISADSSTPRSFSARRSNTESVPSRA